jgi:hypothetical protein
MAAKKRVTKPPDKEAREDPQVLAFLQTLEHPLKAEIEAVRQMILGVDRSIAEGIKWNVPSFRTTDYFATFNLRSKESVQLIFHTGAKIKESATKGVPVSDPEGLLKWLAKDRCLVTLGSRGEVETNRPAFQALVAEWIKAL